MARKRIEAAVLAIEAYLNANLNTYLATIRTEHSSTIPANVAKLSARPSRSPEYPKLTIMKDDHTYNYAYDNQPLIEPWIIYNTKLFIEYSSGSIDEIDDTLMRYVEAIERLTEADDTWGSNFIHVKLTRADWTSLFQNQKIGKAIQGVLLGVQFKTI
jgi:hypothetical protein